ncbi:MAG: tetratricopeptide repeat protein [Deltaproteobacteria bacterium]|nr:MAG: tetratricopeptide repeat protein [Deltaproteobacteria bacterium]
MPELTYTEDGRLQFTGNFYEMPIGSLLLWVLNEQHQGELTLYYEGFTQMLYFTRGYPIASRGGPPENFLGWLLRETGKIDDGTYLQSLQTMATEQQMQGQVLIQMGAINQDQLTDALKLQLQRKILRIFRANEGEFQFTSTGQLAAQDIAPGILNPYTLIANGVRQEYSDERLEQYLDRFAGTMIKRKVDHMSEKLLEKLGLDDVEITALQLIEGWTTTTSFLSSEYLDRTPSLVLLTIMTMADLVIVKEYDELAISRDRRSMGTPIAGNPSPTLEEPPPEPAVAVGQRPLTPVPESDVSISVQTAKDPRKHKEDPNRPRKRAQVTVHVKEDRIETIESLAATPENLSTLEGNDDADLDAALDSLEIPQVEEMELPMESQFELNSTQETMADLPAFPQEEATEGATVIDAVPFSGDELESAKVFDPFESEPPTNPEAPSLTPPPIAMGPPAGSSPLTGAGIIAGPPPGSGVGGVLTPPPPSRLSPSENSSSSAPIIMGPPPTSSGSSPSQPAILAPPPPSSSSQPSVLTPPPPASENKGAILAPPPPSSDSGPAIALGPSTPPPTARATATAAPRTGQAPMASPRTPGPSSRPSTPTAGASKSWVTATPGPRSAPARATARPATTPIPGSRPSPTAATAGSSVGGQATAGSSSPKPAPPQASAGLSEEDQAKERKINSKRRDIDGGCTHYELLEVDRYAAMNAIRDSYYKMSRVFHPDSVAGTPLAHLSDDLEFITSHVNTAYTTLSNKDLKREYDEELADPEAAKMKDRAPVAAQAEVHYTKALVYLKHRDYKKAEEEIRWAIQLLEDEGDFQAVLAWSIYNNDAYGKDEQIKLARHHLAKAEELNADPEKLFFYKGMLEKNEGDYEEALKCFNELLRHNPRHTDGTREMRNIKVLQRREREKKTEEETKPKKSGWGGLFKK